MKKILLSGSVIVAVAAVVVGATTAFYSDTETSTGNVLAAGSIDLGVDNTSYYNGEFSKGTSWGLDYDLGDGLVPNPNYPGCLDDVDIDGNQVPCSKEVAGRNVFFNFDDLKPGDWGEDTISLHIDNNDSWLCVDVTLRSNNDASSTEPELDEVGEVAEDAGNDFDGELAQNLKWYWWADDGDNVFEEGENLINDGVSFPNGEETYHVALADSTRNVWQPNASPAPIPAHSDVRYIAKAWCFGDSEFTAYSPKWNDDNDVNTPEVDDNRSPEDRDVDCDGSLESNITQTDKMTLDLSFRAEQARHNDEFTCQPRVQGDES